MKKLLLGSALAASVLLAGSSFAETKISGSLETTINTKSKKTAGTADNSGPSNIGHEAVIKISTSKELSNGLKMSTGFALDSSDSTATSTTTNGLASDQFVTLSSGKTSFSIGSDVSGVADNVSQEDFTPHVSQDFHSVGIGTIDGVSTAHGSNGIYLKHATDMLTFEGVYSPTTAADNNTGASTNSEGSGSGFDLAVKGSLGVEGLTVGYGMSETKADTADGSGAIELKGTGYGVKYATGAFTVGYGFTKNEDESFKTATAGVDTEHQTYGVAYQVSDQLSVSVALGEADVSNIALDEEYRTIQVGYDFGGMGITAGYYEVENVGGVSGTDQEVFEIRTVTKF